MCKYSLRKALAGVTFTLLAAYACGTDSPQREPVADGVTAIEIADAEECPTCAVEFKRITRLGRPDSTDIPDIVLSVVRDSRGLLYTPLGVPPALIGVWDTTGALIRTIGRPGSGPGELQMPTPVAVLPGDSLVVSDLLQRRLHIFSPDGTPVRSVSTANFDPPEMVVPAREGWVMYGRNFTVHGRGVPLHIVSPDAQVLRSFGGPPVDTAEIGYHPPYAVGPAADGNLWVAKRTRPQVDKWSPDGAHLMSVRRRAPWFSSWEPTPAIMQGREKPHARIMGVTGIDSTHVAVFFTQPTKAWTPSETPTDGREVPVPRLRLGPAPMEQQVELLDLAGKRVVVRHNTPVWVNAVVAPGIVYSVESNPQGHVLIDVWRLTIRR